MSSPPSTYYPSCPSSPSPEVDQVVVVNTTRITLVDNEDQKYEVKTYLLIAWSHVFRNLFESPLTTSETPISADTTTVTLFLDIVQGKHWTPEFEDCKKLVDLCDHNATTSIFAPSHSRVCAFESSSSDHFSGE